tara:strand:+ start:1463 stop:1741 length:279 start_codon:yes stop_codon:yes gene_type:complete
MENEKYNGWTNRFTWLVSLWLDNDQGIHEELKEIANSSEYELDIDRDDALKEFVEELVCVDEASLKCDLINHALSEVNWKEIINEAKEVNEK